MGVLEAKGVSFSYPGSDRAVIRDVGLSVAHDERVCLAAPSGFGKTTLCQLLTGYLRPDAGSIAVDGAPLPSRGLCPVQLVWQHPEAALDPRLTIAASLAEAGSIDEALLDRLGVRRAWLSRYPRELSGGELQRCCIARVLRTHPAFLVADEMTTMLDALTQVQIWEAVLAHCREQGTGLVFTSHSPALVERIATRVVDLTALNAG